MTINIRCSYCGKKPREIAIDEKSDLEIPSLIRAFQREGFIVEENGNHIDTYCRKSCAAGTTRI